MNNVFVLKEVNILDSGENGFYIEVFSTHEKAHKKMLEDIENHKDENGAFEIDVTNHGAELSDDEGNKYYFNIEREVVR